MKLLSPSIEGATAALQVRKSIGGRTPQPVGEGADTPALWSDCVAYVVDDDPAATVDDQDLIVAIAAAPGKLRPADGTPAKARARLAAEIAQARSDREAGKQVGRGKVGRGKAGRGKAGAGR